MKIIKELIAVAISFIKSYILKEEEERIEEEVIKEKKEAQSAVKKHKDITNQFDIKLQQYRTRKRANNLRRSLKLVRREPDSGE